MHKHTKITFENYADYPVGTKVEFHFGAHYAPAEGWVTGHIFKPASKWFPASVELTATYVDPETDEEVDTTISLFSSVGIGVHLIEVAPKKISNKTSPWAQ